MASLLLGTSVMSSHQVHANPSSLSFTNSVSGGGVSLSLAPTTSSLSTSATPPCPPLIYCGRGDKKTAKGKRFNHSFGNARPRNKKKGRGPPKPPYPPPAPKYEAPAAEELLSTETGEE